MCIQNFKYFSRDYTCESPLKGREWGGKKEGREGKEAKEKKREGGREGGIV
jgi:hypothetical protein